MTVMGLHALGETHQVKNNESPLGFAA